MKQLAGIYVRGLCMGVADVIPGVSGGTIAFVSGIYERLIAALRAASSPRVWLLLLSGRIGRFRRAADADFLLALFAGIVSAVFLFARLLHYLLLAHPHLLLGFFFGLVAASVVAVLRRLRKIRLFYFPLFAVCAGFAFGVVSLKAAPLAAAGTAAIFFSGALAICAMILPGISGSFILLVLGVYPALIEAVKDLDLVFLAVFAAGCAAGLLAFARFLHYILSRAHDAAVVALAAIMLGSLPKLWPWKETAAGAKIILQDNVPPAVYAADSQIAFVIFLAAAGALAVAGFDAASAKRKSRAAP